MLRIGQVSDRTGFTRKTLRHYERLGLIRSRARAKGGFRLYCERDLARIEFIRQAKALGFTLREIKTVLSSQAEGKKPCELVRESLRVKRSEVQRAISELEALQAALERRLREFEAAAEA